MKVRNPWAIGLFSSLSLVFVILLCLSTDPAQAKSSLVRRAPLIYRDGSSSSALTWPWVVDDSFAP